MRRLLSVFRMLLRMLRWVNDNPALGTVLVLAGVLSSALALSLVVR